MFDISAVGSWAHMEMYARDLKRDISEFSEEGTPFECPDVDLSTNAKNLNGQMISSRTPPPPPPPPPPLPNSEADLWLTNRMSEAALQPGNVVPIKDLMVKTIQLTIPNINGSSGTPYAEGLTFTWVDGRLKSGPTGPSTSAEGRLSARTFVFEMEKFMPPSFAGNAGANVNSLY